MGHYDNLKPFIGCSATSFYIALQMLLEAVILHDININRHVFG